MSGFVVQLDKKKIQFISIHFKWKIKRLMKWYFPHLFRMRLFKMLFQTPPPALSHDSFNSFQCWVSDSFDKYKLRAGCCGREASHDIWMTHRNCKWCARVWLWRMEIGNKHKWQPIDLSRSLSLFSGCSASIVLSVCAFIYTLININAIKVGAIYFISTSLPSLAHSGVAHFVIVNNRFDIKKSE